MNLDLIIFIKCSGPNVRQDNLTDTIVSFAKKNLNCNYKFYIVAEPSMEGFVRKIFTDFSCLKEDDLLQLKISTRSWAKDFNEFFDKCKNLTQWILISHDDVEYITENYFNKIKEEVKGKEESIGWITSTSDYYYTQENKLVQDTMRAGFYKDYDRWGAMFQLNKMHSLPDLSLLDMPKKAVKVHGIMSAVMLVRSKTLEKIGKCEDWTNYTMIIDEDWSLEALKNNLWNVWIPSVYHKHPLRRSLRPTNNKWEEEAHSGFLKKWGFKTGNYNQGISIPVEELRKKYKNTNIPWSTYRNSYDWEYINE